MDRTALEILVRLAVKNVPDIVPLLSARALEFLDHPEPNVLEPLYRDAVKRMVRREMNDLQGAVRRFLAKSQAREFDAWCDTFYSADQPEFIRHLFKPLLESQKRLSNVDGSAPLETLLQGYLSQQRENVRNKSAETLEKDIETWLEESPERLTEDIINCCGDNL